MTVYEKAKKYYPEKWKKRQLRQLVEVEKLTPEEYKEITGEDYEQE